MSLKIVSYNIKSGLYHPDGLEAIAGVLEELDADVVALQEVDRETIRAGGEDQTAWLAERLDYEHHCFGAATPWEGGGHYGVALLSAAPLEEVETTRLWIPKGKVTTPGEKEPRLLLRARLAGLPLTVMVTHLGLSADQRLRQARQIIACVHETAGQVVVAGDLNGRPDSPEVMLLAQELCDTLGDKPENERITFPSGNPEEHGEDFLTRTLDYILVSRGLQVESARVVPEYTLASDHNPCEAVISV